MALGGLKRWSSGWICSRSEAAYRTTLLDESGTIEGVVNEIPLTVVVFLGRAHVPQAVASLRSFLRSVGRPDRIVVGSDGTLGPADETTLRSLDRCVEIAPAAFDESAEYPELVAYAH